MPFSVNSNSEYFPDFLFFNIGQKGVGKQINFLLYLTRIQKSTMNSYYKNYIWITRLRTQHYTRFLRDFAINQY